MANDVILLHKTPFRLRYRVDALKGEYDQERVITKALALEGVEEVRINSRIGTVIVYCEPSAQERVEQFFSLVRVEQECLDQEAYFVTPQERPSQRAFITASGVLLSEPFVKNDTLKMLLSLIALKPVLSEGLKELFSEGVTSKVLEATAVGVSFARKDYLAANSTGAMLALGEYIEETTVYKSDTLIKALAKPNVETVWIEYEEGGKRLQKQVDTQTLSVGDIVLFGVGDTIAVDGHVIKGNALISQLSMTGESEPVMKKSGDKVLSGTVVEDGRIKVWAERVGEDTATARVKNYIASALSEKSSVGIKATRLADKLVPITLGLAGVSYALSRDFERVAAVLQADYSCALKLATPVAFKSSIAKAGREGVMIKGAKSIEALHQADTFVFDKTGTLTHGRLEVESIHSFDLNWSTQDVLNLAASAEEHYFHPVGEVVVKEAKKRGFTHIHHEEVEFIVAHGVKTTVQGKEVVIGSRHFLEEDEGISFLEHEERIAACLMEGKTLLYVGYDQKLLGTIGMRDHLRDNSIEMLSKLKSLGVKRLTMLTGDISQKAEAMAEELGIDEVYAQLEPTDKADIVKKLKEEGAKVAFIGDGINDAPALMQADVGISMSKGADIAKATADISLLKDDIYAVYEVKELADKTMNLIHNNFNATVGINSLILLGASVGAFSPVTTAVLHNGTTIGLLLNSLKGV